MSQSSLQTLLLPARNYDLTATLSSGQAFRWRQTGTGWEGVIAGRWVHLTQTGDGIAAHAIELRPAELAEYLQTNVDLDAILRTFPDDAPLRASVEACRGLRLLRQDPWECLVSFICSSTKQIVQIQQIIHLLCARFGESIPRPKAESDASSDGLANDWPRSFPSAERLASVSESELRACKMGFRAPYVRAAAQAVTAGKLNLESLRGLACDEAREALVRLPGVGPKIANCVLLFAYGYQAAFPVDVWVMKALRELYFPRRRPTADRLQRFVRTYFGPNAGYAQQYLFHYMRTRS